MFSIRTFLLDAAKTVLIHRPAVDRPQDIVCCTVDNSVVERQAADKPQLRIVFIKLVKPPGVIFMPLEPIHRIYQIILKEICVLE